MAISVPKAPTAPKAPTPPSMNTENAVPESTIESSGPAVPAGELETPASKFGIHIQLGGSEAVQPQFTEEAAEGKTQSRDKTQSQNNTVNNPNNNTKNDTEKTPQQEPQELTGQQVVQYLSGEDRENQQSEGSLKVVPQEEGLFDGFNSGHTSYWPFLLVFMVAFASFLIMHFMKKKENDDFGSLNYKKNTVPLAVQKAYQENITPVKPARKPVPAKKEPPKRFEVRI